MSISSVLRSTKRGIVPYLFLLPCGILLTSVVGLPVFYTVFSSFFGSPSISTAAQFVFLENYRKMLQDPMFWFVLRNTGIWTVCGVAFKCIIGLTIALVLNQQFPGRNIIRLIVLLPWATMLVVSGITWRWIFNSLYGFLNSILFNFGLIDQPITWLSSSYGAFLACFIASAWTIIPFHALAFLSGLQTIPQELYESADCEGASALQKFKYITLPLLKPILLIVMTISTIWTFNAFSTIMVLTGGGPLHATEIMVTFIYKNAFRFSKIGYANAMATTTFLILLLVSLVYVLPAYRKLD